MPILDRWLHLNKDQGQDRQEGMKIENPLVVRFLTIDLVGIYNQDLPDYVKEQGIKFCLRFEPCQHQNDKDQTHQSFIDRKSLFEKRPTKIGKKARMR